MLDVLSRETEDGNVVDLYLKKRGWKEKVIPKTYMRGVRRSFISLYEVSAIEPGKSFLARDLILENGPVRVDEKDATRTMAQHGQFAMRIVEMRGHQIIAGSVLPFEPDMPRQIIAEIHQQADMLVDKANRSAVAYEQDEMPGPERLRAVLLQMVLKIPAPRFTGPRFTGPRFARTVPDTIDMDTQTTQFPRR